MAKCEGLWRVVFAHAASPPDCRVVEDFFSRPFYHVAGWRATIPCGPPDSAGPSRDVPGVSFFALYNVAAKLRMRGADNLAGTRRTSLIAKVERAQLLFTPNTVKFSLGNGF